MGHPKVTKTPEQLQKEKAEAERINREIAENLEGVEGLFDVLKDHYDDEITVHMVQPNGQYLGSDIKVGFLRPSDVQYEKQRIEAGARDAQLPITNPGGWVDTYPVNGVRCYIRDLTVGINKIIWSNPRDRFGPIGLCSRRARLAASD